MKRTAFLLLLLLLAVRGLANDIRIYSGTVKKESFDGTGSYSASLPCYVVFDFTLDKLTILEVFRANKSTDATGFRTMVRYTFPTTGTKRRDFIYIDAPGGASNPLFLRFRGTAAPAILPISTLLKAQVSRTLAFTMSFKDYIYLLYERTGTLSYQQALTVSANDADLALDDAVTLVRNDLIRRKIINPP
jgi:hypothetical protein